MPTDSVIRLTIRSGAQGSCAGDPSESLMVATHRVEGDGWHQAPGVVICDRPSISSTNSEVQCLDVYDLLSDSGHLQVAIALGELDRYRILAHRLMVAVIGAQLLRSGLALSHPEQAHHDIGVTLDRLIDQVAEHLG